MHKQGTTNYAVRGVSLDSLLSVLDSLGVSGGGSGGTVIAYYQNTQNNGSNLPQRNTINFKSGNPNLTVVAADNVGSGRTDVTITAPGGSVTSTSDEIMVISGSGASLKPFSVQFLPENVSIDEFSGELPFTMLEQGGATPGMVPIWTPSGWVPGLVSANGNYVAGEGINITGNILSNTGDFNASDDVLITSEFDGDVSGTYNNLSINNGAVTMPKIAQAGATSGQVLKWNGTAWAPANDAGGTTYAAGSGISIVGNAIINNGDLSNSNELQTLNLAGQTLSISGGNSVSLPVVGISAGTNVTVSNASGVVTINASGGGGEIDTLASYAALRSYPDSAKYVVFVNDFTYVYNDVTYTTKGGLFIRTSSGTENGGETIVGTFIWKRFSIKREVLPEWWQVGGYDVDGTTSPSRFTLNGIYNDRDRAFAAHRIAGIGGTVLYGTIVKQYNVDKSILVYKDQTIMGNGVVFKRVDSPPCIVLSNPVGTTTITVSNASHLRVGQTIVLADTSNTRGATNHIDGLSYGETTRDAQIIAISGNVLTINLPFIHPGSSGAGFGNIGIGARVYNTTSIFVHAGTPDLTSTGEDYYIQPECGNLRFQQCNFDGNRLNGIYSDYPVAYWLNMWTIEPGGGGYTNVVIEQCNFYDMPAENVFGSNGGMYQCNFKRCGGSGFHYAQQGDISVSTKPNVWRMVGCVMDSMCLATNIRTGHSEAAIVNSNNTEFQIDNVTIKNCRESCFVVAPDENTPWKAPNNMLNISGGHFENNRQFIGCFNTNNLQYRPYVGGINVEGTTMIRTGDIFLDFERLQQGQGAVGVNISNNFIAGGQMYFSNIYGLNVSNNTMLFHADSFYFPKFADKIQWKEYRNAYLTEQFNHMNSAIAIKDCSQVNISKNTIEGFASKNDTLQTAISIPIEWFGWPDTLRTVTGAQTDFYWPSNITISGNIIKNFQNGIAAGARASRNVFSVGSQTKMLNNWTISDNEIEMSKDTVTLHSNHSYGIWAFSGTTIVGNKIRKQSNRQKDVPLIYFGLETAPGADTLAQRYFSVVAGNQIDAGGDVAVKIGDGTGFASGNINMNFNWIVGTIEKHQNFDLWSDWSGNKIINSTLLPKLTNPRKGVSNGLWLAKNQY